LWGKPEENFDEKGKSMISDEWRIEMSLQKLLQKARTAFEIAKQVGTFGTVDYPHDYKWVSTIDLRQLIDYWTTELHRLETGKKMANKENIATPTIDGAIDTLKMILGNQELTDYLNSPREGVKEEPK